MKKKYFLLFTVYILTILFVFYCSKIYSNSLTNIDDASINNVTSSNYGIMFKNISNYSMEQEEFVICVAPGSINMSNFNLFIDSSVVKKRDLNRLVKDFGYSYSFNNRFPVFIVFKGGKVVDVTYDLEVIK